MLTLQLVLAALWLRFPRKRKVLGPRTVLCWPNTLSRGCTPASRQPSCTPLLPREASRRPTTSPSGCHSPKLLPCTSFPQHRAHNRKCHPRPMTRPPVRNHLPYLLVTASCDNLWESLKSNKLILNSIFYYLIFQMKFIKKKMHLPYRNL